MEKRRKNKAVKKYVMHPRYGDKPIASEFSFLSEEIERAHWRYRSAECFVETAIPANIEKQEVADFPRKIYVDIEERCEVCKRLFLFFALEQKYWFEALGFWIDSHCTRCMDCRLNDREIRSMQKRYQELVNKDGRTVDETKELKQFALELYMRGYIKDKNKIDKIK